MGQKNKKKKKKERKNIGDNCNTFLSIPEHCKKIKIKKHIFLTNDQEMEQNCQEHFDSELHLRGEKNFLLAVQDKSVIFLPISQGKKQRMKILTSGYTVVYALKTDKGCTYHVRSHRCTLDFTSIRMCVER